MNKPHKWAKEIKAWADGAEIQISYYSEEGKDVWVDTDEPLWHVGVGYEYHIKPQPKEPQYLYVYEHEGNGISFGYKPHGALNMWQTKIIGKIKLEQDDEK